MITVSSRAYYHASQSCTNLIIFLDRTPFQCAFRAIKRNIPYLFKPRPGLPDGCIEIWSVPYLLKLIFKFNSVVRPRILEDILPEKHIILYNDYEVSAFLETLYATDESDVDNNYLL